MAYIVVTTKYFLGDHVRDCLILDPAVFETLEDADNYLRTLYFSKKAAIAENGYTTEKSYYHDKKDFYVEVKDRFAYKGLISKSNFSRGDVNMEQATLYDLQRYLAKTNGTVKLDSNHFSLELHFSQSPVMGTECYGDMKKLNDFLVKWVEDHPYKTRLTEFKKLFPDAEYDNEGYPSGCLLRFDKDYHCENIGCNCCNSRYCYWNKEID